MSDSTTSPGTPDMVTRCPQCSTSFRITPAQLKTAKGAVRCGSCLQIFKALDNLVTPKPTAIVIDDTAAQHPKSSAQEKMTFSAKGSREIEAQTKPQTPPPKAAAQKPETTQPSWKSDDRLNFDQAAIDEEFTTGFEELADDDLLISDDMDSIEDTHSEIPAAFDSSLSESFLELDSWQPESKSLFDREAKDKNLGKNDRDNTDETWAVNLLQELEDEENTHEEEQPTAEKPETKTLPDDNDLNQAPSTRDYSRKTTGNFTALSDEEIEAVLGESFTNVNEPSISVAGINAPVEISEDFNTEAIFADNQDRGEYLANIEPEPVEMVWAMGERSWPRTLLWSGLSLIAAFGLIAQTAWFQFDRYSRVEPYRSWYTAACSAFGCRLPPLVDHSQIRAYNLVVRSHPRAEKALMVDTILLNTAPFQQPFPELVLTFSNLQGKPMATRQFSPEEYLGGELAGQRQMPMGQPVHLSLEVVDPGPEAVNYSAQIP